ncbi:hypothetical protein [Schlesneria paludicola]|uniref:hypothetical protein n=1 Tax=Schlesneria paludicola TaxID=360056 RepID=UPI00029A82A9|nr:hypothetical protein [Schlesneria paludicola]
MYILKEKMVLQAVPMSNVAKSAKFIRRGCWSAGAVAVCALGLILYQQTNNQLTITNHLDVPVTIESVLTQVSDDEPVSALPVLVGGQTVASGQAFRSSFRGQPHARLRITYHLGDGPTFYHEYGTIRTWGFRVLMTFQDKSAPHLVVTASRLREWIEVHRSWLPFHGKWFD